MSDPRNRPVIVGSAIAGVAVFALLLWFGSPPVPAWLLGWAVPAFAAYGLDKRRAVNDGWRVPESVLHGLALVGGIIGAWAGRAVFRHKTRKPIFTVVLIVASMLWATVAAWTVLT